MFLLILNAIGSYNYSISKKKKKMIQAYKQFRERQKTCQGDAMPSSTDDQTDYSSSAC